MCFSNGEILQYRAVAIICVHQVEFALTFFFLKDRGARFNNYLSHYKIQVNSMSMSTLAGDTLPESTLIGDAIREANDIILRRTRVQK